MATIKSITDIEQSRKLAEILPLESADMYYALSEDESTNMVNFGKPQGFFDKTQVAWSLAALLIILPNEVEIDGQRYAPCLFTVNKGWIYKLWYNSNKIFTSPISVFEDNPVDACYEMILKLHELNLL